MGAADLGVLLLDVLHDDPQADLSHLFQLRVPRTAGGAVPGLQPVQQVHHPLEDLQQSTTTAVSGGTRKGKKKKKRKKGARPVSTPGCRDVKLNYALDYSF